MKYDKNELDNLINNLNYSYSAIGRLYGVTGAAIKKSAKKLGIALPSRRRINPNEKFSHEGKTCKRDENSLVNIISDDEFKLIIDNNNSWCKIGEKLGYKSKVLSQNVKDAIEDRCLTLNLNLNIHRVNDILTKTKGELFRLRKNWQSARSAIQKSARKIYFSEQEIKECLICGYGNHVEISHIIPVSSFNDDVLIYEINNINNLMALCPNHHWEYDNEILKIKN
jgi:5-methylcytosine-specific restriction endonuclease McrA